MFIEFWYRLVSLSIENWLGLLSIGALLFGGAAVLWRRLPFTLANIRLVVRQELALHNLEQSTRIATLEARMTLTEDNHEGLEKDFVRAQQYNASRLDKLVELSIESAEQRANQHSENQKMIRESAEHLSERIDKLYERRVTVRDQ